MNPETVTLYCEEGRSNKEYQVNLVQAPAGGGWLVNVAWGPRGATKPGTKTKEPVSYEEAKKLYDKVVLEKTRKGYSPGPDGARFQGTELAGRATGIVPQLLNDIDPDEVEARLADPAFVVQEKHDGKRILIEKKAGIVTGINRLSLSVGLPEAVAAAALALPGEFVLDGELVGTTYHAFDLLMPGPYVARLPHLASLFAGVRANGPIRLVSTALGEASKRALLAEVRNRRGEGIVFKDLGAEYMADRPASGGPQLKLKFTETASCLVLGVNRGKRSVRLGLKDGDSVVDVGNVAIPANRDIPAPGDVVEVRYLYARKGGSLYQPFFLGKRDDVTPAHCALAQLKFKPEADADDDG